MRYCSMNGPSPQMNRNSCIFTPVTMGATDRMYMGAGCVGMWGWGRDISSSSVHLFLIQT